jgi:predicted O-methyltransferase YrrM
MMRILMRTRPAALPAAATTVGLFAFFVFCVFFVVRVAVPLVVHLEAQSVSPALSPGLVKLMHEIKAADRDALAVSEEDGRFLRLMVASSGAKRAWEIGGAHGYSAIWIGLGLRETGGHLTTIEFDPVRAKMAAEHIRRAGLAGVVTVVSGDAFKEIPKIAGDVDFVFLDAWKRDYKRFLDLVLPRMTPGALFLAHNVVNKQEEMRDFLTAIRESPSLFTAIVSPSGEGMSISYKLRQPGAGVNR